MTEHFRPLATLDRPPGSWKNAEYHFADITPEEAATVNACVDIKGYAAVHGFGPAEADMPELDIEYEAAKNIVDSLDPSRGDVLFIEDTAHDGTTPHMDWEKLGIADPEGFLEERARKERMVSAFVYARELAHLRGIPVISADLHRGAANRVLGELDTYAAANPGNDPLQHLKETKAVLYALREEQAANIVKDYALESLAELQARHNAGDPKPTYAVLWGRGHYEDEAGAPPSAETPGIEAAFDRLGLHIDVTHAPHALEQRAAYGPRKYDASAVLGASATTHA